MASLTWLVVGLVSPVHDLASFLPSLDSLIGWSLERLRPSIEAFFKPSLVLHLIMSPWPKLLMWLKPGLGVRELPNSMTSGWAVILSIFCKKMWPQASFFSVLIPCPLALPSSDSDLQQSVYVWACIPVFLQRMVWRRERIWDRGCNKDELRECSKNLYVSPTLIWRLTSCLNKSHLQKPHVQSPLSFLVHSYVLSPWFFLDLKQEEKDVIVLDLVWS